MLKFEIPFDRFIYEDIKKPKYKITKEAQTCLALSRNGWKQQAEAKKSQLQSDNNWFVLDKNGNKIADKTVRKFPVNIQGLYNNTMKHHERSRKVSMIKENLFYPTLKAQQRVLQTPIRIEMQFNSSQTTFDASNLGAMLFKTFEDSLKHWAFIPDDSVNHVNDTGRIKYNKIPKGEQETLVVTVYENNYA